MTDSSGCSPLAPPPFSTASTKYAKDVDLPSPTSNHIEDCSPDIFHDALVLTPTPDHVEDSSLEIFQDTPIPTLVLTPALTVAQVSESYCAVSRLARTQLLGTTFSGLCENVLLPERLSGTSGIQAALEGACPHILEHQAHEGGFWSTRIIPIYRRHADGRELRNIIMEFTDVTDAHLKQVELQEKMYANDTFRILVETVKDYAIFMLDPAGNVATWNAGAKGFKGYTKSEVIGKHFSTFYSQEDRDNGKPARELVTALRDGRVEDEGWRYRKDGTRFWANVIITPIFRDDVLLGFSKVTRDLSERRKAESSLIDAYEEASKLKSEFLANMSHEIRTPMHGMLSALTLLLDTQLDPEQMELARVIEESGEILLQVINDILDYSKLASGSFSISHDIISVPDIIQSVFRAHQKCCKPEVLLESKIDPQLTRAAEGDSLRYRQIVQNLLSNAVKFTEEGYVRINAALESEDDDAFVVMTEVIDSGIGVPDAATGDLFTPFMQFDNSATKRYKGTGLGLSICKNLAELMGGRIGFRPNPTGAGSIFWFTSKLKKVQQITTITSHLPTRPTLSTNHPSPISPTILPPFSEIKHAAINKRILLAEDNPINRTVMVKLLTSLGFSDIDLATNGGEAVSLCLGAAAVDPYDIVLMDINMPVLDGVQATRKIRESGLGTPIVAMTANALKGHAESYIAKGMSGYVAKPVDRKVMVKVLLGCLRGEEPG